MKKRRGSVWQWEPSKCRPMTGWPQSDPPWVETDDYIEVIDSDMIEGSEDDGSKVHPL